MSPSNVNTDLGIISDTFMAYHDYACWGAKMITFEYDENKKCVSLKFEGRLTIENVEELKNSFLSSFEKTDHIILDHSNAEEYDFAYLQLLLAVLKTSERSNKKFEIINENSDRFLELYSNAGFGNTNGTKFFIEENKRN